MRAASYVCELRPAVNVPIKCLTESCAVVVLNSMEQLGFSHIVDSDGPVRKFEGFSKLP